ncbi:hypothetical protein SY88_04030 [Clostridiales bacterium PH28_bin88]|nr:hypothetical protein SY88_04030 [Clostridiales bacterium PH28_bin88]
MLPEKWRFDLQLFAQEKTEEATPHRREEVRRKGQVARSSDMNAAVGMAALVLLLLVTWRSVMEQVSRFFIWLLGGSLTEPVTALNLGYLFSSTAVFFLKLMAPVFLVALAAGLVVNFAQVGFNFSAEPTRLRLENLNPAEGFKRIISRRALVELGKALLKVTAVGVVTYTIVRGRFAKLLFLADMGLPQGVALVADVIFRVALGAVAIFAVIAVLDFMFQRREFRERIKMSKQEVKEELKQTEGDPQIKAKLRERQRQLAMRRMIQSVPRATVVITNPTHLAIALKYENGQAGAPEVVAKGGGDIAKRIVEVAREHKVPVVENKPVAQFLYKNVEIGQEIPAELYQAVAEILAMLYRIKRY